MHFERILISLWFRFRFRCRSARLTVSRFVHFTHSICYFFFLIFAHSTFVVYSPNFGLSFVVFFFVGNLTRLFIHSQLTVTHAFVLPAALATTTNEQQEEQQLGDINFYFVVVLLQTKHFCRGQHQQQEQQLPCERREAPGTAATTTRKTTSTNCAHSSVVSL